MNYKFVSKNVDPNSPEIKKLIDEAFSVVPKSFLRVGKGGIVEPENTVVLLPREPLKGFCRLCGKFEVLTKEHIPPKSSGNKERHTKLTFDDWLNDKMNTNPSIKRRVEQGGIFGYTLCRSCNSLTGHLYGNEYKKWVELAKKQIDSLGKGMVALLDTLPGPFGENFIYEDKKDSAIMPGAFVRQVLSCMCSLSGSWNLADVHPSFRRIILNKSAEPLPQGMALGMYIFFGPQIRVHGPQLRIDAKTKIWRWVQEIAYPPYAFHFVIASNNPNPGLGLLINNFTTFKPEARHGFSGIVEMGFGWTPYPGDFRSKAAINASRK